MILVVILGLGLLAGGVILILQATSSTRSGGTSEAIGQIESYGFAAAPTPERERASHQPLKSLASEIGGLSQRVVGTGERGIRRQLLAAGMYDVEPATIVGYRFLAVAALVILWLWVSLTQGFSPVLVLLGIVVGGVVGWMLPVTY